MGRAFHNSAACAGLMLVLGCVTYPQRPCQEGGEPATDQKIHWTKQCDQKLDRASGKWLNDGRYVEWYPNGKRAMLGEYKLGKKHGKWLTWDENGKQLSEKYYFEGQEIPRFDTPMKRIAGAPPPLTPEEQQIRDERERQLKEKAH